MKNFHYIFLLVIGSLFVSCEQVIENPNLPFEERIVVYGLISPNEQLELYVTKTVPALVIVPEFSLLRDAIVTIETEGRTYTLVPKDSVLDFRSKSYFTTKDLVFEEGKQYNLTVQWNGKTVKSSTFIPPKPIVSSFWYSDSTKSNDLFFQTFTTNISTRNIPNTVIMGISIFPDTSVSIKDILYVDNPYELLSNIIDSDSTVLSFARGYNDFIYFSSQYIRLLAFDPAFEQYLKTVDRRDNSDGIFGGGGKNPIWNVNGDGFGLFLGVNPGYAVNINRY